MGNEPEEFEREPRDWAKLIWLGIAAGVALMVLALWWAGRPEPGQSTARASHILVRYDPTDPADRARALGLINDLRQRIEDGADFGRLARDYSEDPTSGARGGDLGYRPRGAYDDNFERYVWEGPVGELSEVIVSSHGFHLIKVTDRYLTPADEYELELELRAREKLRQGAGETVEEIE